MLCEPSTRPPKASVTSTPQRSLIKTRTPPSQPHTPSRPSSSLGFRNLLKSLGPSSSKASTLPSHRPNTPSVTPLFKRSLSRATKTAPVSRLPVPFPSPPRTSVGNRLRPPPPIWNLGKEHGAVRSLHHPQETQRRDPRWKHVEAEWRGQAGSLRAPHGQCLLGAVCMDIKEPLSDLGPNFFREYLDSRPRCIPSRAHPSTPASPTKRSLPSTTKAAPPGPVEVEAVVPDHIGSLKTHSRPTHSALTLSRQVLDRPRPCKRRCQTPDSSHSPTFLPNPTEARQPHPAVRSVRSQAMRVRPHSMPSYLERRTCPPSALATSTPLTPAIDLVTSPWTVLAAPRHGDGLEDCTDGILSPLAWVMVAGDVDRSPSPPQYSPIRARWKRLRELESGGIS